MFNKALHLLILSAILLVLGCENKSELTINQKLGFNNQEYTKTLKDVFYLTDSRDPIFYSVKNLLDTLRIYYLNRNFEPIFVKSYDSKNFIDSLLSILKTADKHGLNVESYNCTLIDSFFNSSTDPQNNPENRVKNLAITELLVSDAIVKFSKHMRNGLVNPRELYPEVYYLPVNDSLNLKLFEPLNVPDVITYLNNIQPKSIKYKNLQSELIKFSSKINLDWEKIPELDVKIKAGENFSSINIIAKRLFQLGFIDTSKIKIDSIKISYDSSLVSSIKEFQRANGFNEDGIINKSLIERLNITPEKYVEKIKLNLERLRWTSYSDTSRYILVNIPDFKVYAIENNIEKLDIKICTGRKIEWETPNLYGQISYFVLNPTWSVPRSIIQEEIVNGLKRDTSYLKKRNFIAYKGGKPVSLDGLTAQEIAKNNYSLVQNPGAGNALGKVKFMFKNPFGVYLHDTPTRAPFNYVNRAVSHGCMRVEKPMLLADYLLHDNSKWSVDYLKLEIGQKINNPIVEEEFKRVRSDLRKNSSYGVTTEIKLNKYIPLFVDYYTMWVDKNGKLNYRDDIYGRDKKLVDAMKQ